MPAVALREPFSKAFMTSSRSGARSATTRSPVGVGACEWAGHALIVRGVGADGSVPEPHEPLVQSDVDRLADVGCALCLAIGNAISWADLRDWLTLALALEPKDVREPRSAGGHVRSRIYECNH